MAYFDVDTRQDLITSVGKPVGTGGRRSGGGNILDRAARQNEKEMNQIFRNMQANLKDYGKLKDKVTGITTRTELQRMRLEEVKNELGVNDEGFANAMTSIEDPHAFMGMSMRVQMLANHPVVTDIAQEGVLMDRYLNDVSKISDNNLRGMAMDHYTKVIENKDPNEGNLLPRFLNIDQFKPMDVENEYRKILANKFPKQERDLDGRVIDKENGVSYRVREEFVDTDGIDDARMDFIDNTRVRNNLIADGKMDLDGNMVDGGAFFDDIEKSYIDKNTRRRKMNERKWEDPNEPVETKTKKLSEKEKQEQKEQTEYETTLDRLAEYYTSTEEGAQFDKVPAKIRPVMTMPLSEDNNNVSYNIIEFGINNRANRTREINQVSDNWKTGLYDTDITSIMNGIEADIDVIVDDIKLNENETKEQRKKKILNKIESIKSNRSSSRESKKESARKGYTELLSILGDKAGEHVLKYEREVFNNNGLSSIKTQLPDGDPTHYDLPTMTYIVDTYNELGFDDFKSVMNGCVKMNPEYIIDCLMKKRSSMRPDNKKWHEALALKMMYEKAPGGSTSDIPTAPAQGSTAPAQGSNAPVQGSNAPVQGGGTRTTAPTRTQQGLNEKKSKYGF